MANRKRITSVGCAVAWCCAVTLAAGGECENRAFDPAVIYSVDHDPPGTVAPRPHVLLTEDFDGDGDLDFASLNREYAEVGILKNNGDGTFGQLTFHTISVSTTSGCEGMCAGDFDGDGDMDIAAVDYWDSKLIVLWNTGAGAFPTHDTYPVLFSSYPHGALSVDIDKDGDLDVVTSNDLAGSVSVFKNDGTGKFSIGTSFAAGKRPQFSAAGDFDGDGDLDIAVANLGMVEGSLPEVTVHRNNGGVFQLTDHLAVPLSSASDAIVTEDLDADGHLDLVVGSWTDNALCIFWGEGAGGFTAADVHDTPGTAVQPVIADLDGDGRLDITISCFEAPVVYILWNEGNRAFAPGPSLATAPDSKPRYPAVGDFDKDGDLDVASVQYETATIDIFWNRRCHLPVFKRADANGDGAVNIGDPVYILGYLFGHATPPACLATADANGEGAINVADAVYVLGYLFGNGNPPPPPFTECGTDQGSHPIECASYPPCGRR
jgi:hypothetical protein